MVKIEVEVTGWNILEEALAQGVDTIRQYGAGLFAPRGGVAKRQKAVLEASGNVTLQTIAENGVDYISSGAITTFGAEFGYWFGFLNHTHTHHGRA